MSKDAIDEGAQKRADRKKVDEPWTDKERLLIVSHVLSHVRFTDVLNGLPELLTKGGCPARPKQAYRDQRGRKICKDLLDTYSGSANSPVSPTKAGSSYKAAASPSKRKRKE